MAGIIIRFNQPAQSIQGGPIRLVFGERTSKPIDPVFAEGSGELTGIGGSMLCRTLVLAEGDASLAHVDGSVGLAWDSNVSRTTRVELAAHWQEAQPVSMSERPSWQQTELVSVAAMPGWQEAVPVSTSARSHWQESERVRAAARGRWQEASPVRGAVLQSWQEAMRMRAAARAHWQEALSMRGAARAHWQESLRMRGGIVGEWQEAVPVRALLRDSYGGAVPVIVGIKPHWQEAMRPPVGVTVVKPPVKTPCYVPGLPLKLVFRDKRVAGLPLRLIFKCDGHRTLLPPKVVVPAQRTYIVVNSVEIRRADSLSGDPLPSERFSMSLNADSWSWTFNATFHKSARDAVMPGMDGKPVELDVRVNGQPFRLLAEQPLPKRQFAEHTIAVSGRGLAAVLDDQSVIQTFSNALGTSAHQLMTEVLTLNGVGFGWSVDWQLDHDWIVPGGAWMQQGTWMGALKDIAGAVGGYLQPHDTAEILRVLPKWPQPWWRFNMLTPDYELPEGYSEIDETEYVVQPDYNRIFVSGEAGGILGDLSIDGTNSDLAIIKPMVTHPLITSLEAAKMRAIKELSESGRGLKHKLILPIAPLTGVIKPGAVLRYYDESSVQRTGIVRSTNVSMETFPELTQSLEVESHV